MGLGMGGTMMPIMTSALQTLKDHEIARGSTLMNITQQVAASIGTALFSVLLTNGFNSSDAAGPAIASLSNPDLARTLPPGLIVRAVWRTRPMRSAACSWSRRSWSRCAWSRRCCCRGASRPPPGLSRAPAPTLMH